MRRHFSSQGLVLAKKDLLKNDRLVIIFSRDFGKISLLAKGVRKITSRRLSHLETGNFIKFSYYRKDDRLYLRETDLVFGHSKIKQSPEKIGLLYLCFLVLKKILPEEQKESQIFQQTLVFLKRLNNRQSTDFADFENYLSQVLLIAGFVSKEKLNQPNFNLISYTEDLIGEKMRAVTI